MTTSLFISLQSYKILPKFQLYRPFFVFVRKNRVVSSSEEKQSGKEYFSVFYLFVFKKDVNLPNEKNLYTIKHLQTPNQTSWK